METTARSSSLLDDFATGAAARSWCKFLFVIYNPQILLLSTIAMISPFVVRMRIVATTRGVNQSDDTQYRLPVHCTNVGCK